MVNQTRPLWFKHGGLSNIIWQRQMNPKTGRLPSSKIETQTELHEKSRVRCSEQHRDEGQWEAHKGSEGGWGVGGGSG